MRVLPRVRARAPQFCLNVTGAASHDLAPVAGIAPLGFVPNVAPLYAEAPFAICPILGKTGQQVKIGEAMAHGVPVIATRAAAEGSPIRHLENGLVAADAQEFAEYMIALWQDRALCRRMGDAARATITQNSSRARLLEDLSSLLSAPQPHSV